MIAPSSRLARVAEMGYDDILLVKRDSSRRLGLYEADLSKEDLAAIRGLLLPIANDGLL